MQRDDERDLISAWQSGSLPAAEAFVRQRQTEARTIAFLLTLNKGQARGLVNSAFVRFLRSARSMDPDADTRVEFLARLCRIFLRGDYEVVTDAPGDILPGGPPEKYGVDNQRDRTIAALGRLEERERVALVLSEIAGFGPEQLNLVLERGNTALVAPIETGRQRLRHSLDIPQGQPVRSVLLDASFDGPREDLWPGLADDIAQVHREEQRRGQLITYGVVAGTILVALIAIVALFSNDLFNRDADNSSAAADTTATVGAITTPAPTPVPPTPTPTPEPLPLGNVPDLMFASVFDPSTASISDVSVARFDPDASELERVALPESVANFSDIVNSWITPDGGTYLFVRGLREAGLQEYHVIAVDSTTFEVRWDVSIGEFEVNPISTLTMPPVTATSDALYVAYLNVDAESITVEVRDLTDGTLVNTVDIDVALDERQAELAAVIPFPTPDQSELLLVVTETPAWSGTQAEASQLVRVSLPDLEISEVRNDLFEDAEHGRFRIWGATLTPDGSAFYQMHYSVPGSPAAVEFLDIETGARTAVMVPFVNPEGLPFRNMTMFHTHDGYRMFLIDALSGDVAVIHLTERRLERQFEIDPGSFASQFGLGEGQFAFTWSSLLSMDGQRLYVAAGEHRTDNQPQASDSSGVWVINLNTWTIIDFWPVDGTVGMIVGEAGEDSVLLTTIDPNQGRSGPVTRVGRQGSGVESSVVSEPGLGDGAYSVVSPFFRQYQSQYGRSAAVDGVEPVTLERYSTLPDVRASSTNNVVSNKDATVSVRIYDPLTGNVLRAPREDVRFDPDSTITATLTLEGQPSQLLVLNEDEPGVYRANASLPADGTWDINVSIIAPDGSTRLVPQAGTVQVAPTLTGSDGERYQFRVTFDPRSPTVGEEATFRIRLVNVDSGAIVSEDVTFDVKQAVLGGGTIEDLPDRLSMSLGNPATYFGTRSIIAGETSYGIWDGRITFQDAGTWTTAIRLQFADMPLAEIPSTRVAVHAAQ